MITGSDIINYATVVNGFILMYNNKKPTYDTGAIGKLLNDLTMNFATKDWNTFAHIFSTINKTVLGFENMKMDIINSDPQLNKVYLKLLSTSLPIKTWLCQNGYSKC